MARKRSAFDAWFVAQYGPRPSRLSLIQLDERMDAARAEWSRLSDEYARAYQWDDNRDAALKAWQAKEGR